jgi:dihydroorotase
MSTVIKGGKIYRNGSFEKNDVLVIDGNGAAETGAERKDDRVITLDNSFILPAFCDVHVHFREPGQSRKETIKTGSMAAAHGGYAAVCTMPNLDPRPTDMDTLREELSIIERDAVVDVIPYGGITRPAGGRRTLADMEAMSPYVAGFSDDGTGVQDAGLMREAMSEAKSLGKIIAAHCEDDSLVRDGKIRESEWRQIERDLRLADITGAAYHVCHISCRESVELIRDAKKSGVDVTCETAPHYLMLNDEMIGKAVDRDPESGGRYKMNPPVKTEEDRKALIEGVIDGTVDMIATDHAPHTAEEKARGFRKSLNGITGLDCAFPVLYTGLVETGVLTLERLTELMSLAPERRFGIDEPDSFTVIGTSAADRVDSGSFFSLGKSTPFDGMSVSARVMMTVCRGKTVYENLE